MVTFTYVLHDVDVHLCLKLLPLGDGIVQANAYCYLLHNFQFSNLSEGIAYPEIEAQAVKEGRDIKITGDRLREVRRTLLAVSVGLVRGVESYAQVQADDESVQVEADSGACTQGNLPGELGIVDESVLQLPLDPKCFDK